jgi:hypothetical protein
VQGWRSRGPEFRPSKCEFRGPKPERRPNTEGRSHALAFRLSGFGLLSALGFRASGLGLCAHGLFVLSRYARARGVVGTRHAKCCVLAHDDLVNLLGWHLLGLLSGILERRGPPGTEPGRANGFAARACCCFAECEDGLRICRKRGSFALPNRLAAVQGQELSTSSSRSGVSRRLTGRRFKAATVCFHPWLN